MNQEKPMSILLIEDNEDEVKEIHEYTETREDIKIVETTNSSYDGLKHVKMHMPEGIILDLELHNGKGSGIHFLEELQKIELDFKPLIIVTTNVASDIIYSHIRNLGSDFIFYKKQKDYKPELIINLLVSLRKSLNKDSKGNGKTTETPIDYEKRIKDKINTELDLIGISNHLKGRKYLFDAIFYLIQSKENDDITVFNYLANLYKIGNSSISRAMQTSINHAWKISSIEDLLTHYKAKVNYGTGVPTPTEFIYYYRDKISKLL